MYDELSEASRRHECIRKKLRRTVPPLDSHAFIAKNIHEAFSCLSSLQDWHEGKGDHIPGDIIMNLIDEIGEKLCNIIEAEYRLIDKSWR